MSFSTNYGSQQALVSPPASYPQVYPQVAQQQSDPFPLVMATSVPQQQASAPGYTEQQQGLAQTIQVAMYTLECQATELREQNRVFDDTVARAEGCLTKIKRVKEGKGGVETKMPAVNKIRDWVAANKGLVICSLAVVSLASMLSVKNLRLPAIRIKIEGGGMYIQKTGSLYNYIPKN